MSIMVYKFGLQAPHFNAELVREQMWNAHRYRNDLVQIERARRAALRQLLSEGGTAEAETRVAEADKTLLAAIQAAKGQKIAGRTRKIDPGAKEAIAAARIAKKEALAVLYRVRSELRETLKAAKEAIDDRAAEMRRGARALCNTYWGTYLLIEDEDMAMRKMPLFDNEKPNDPKFVRWENMGQLGVQIQGGISVRKMLDANDTRIRIVPQMALPGGPRTSKRGAKREFVELSMRVGSNDDGTPVWARWNMLMHREMTEADVVKRAAVVLRRVGPREQWYVTITVERSGSARQLDVDAATKSKVVGVDIGWRQTDDGELRAAAWRGGDDAGAFVNVPPKFLGGIQKVLDLESIRDKAFNAARETLVQWVKERSELPSWFVEATKTLAQWRSISRLTALVKRWKRERFGGDEMAYMALEAWRYHDHHLWNWECSQRQKSLGFRRDGYRVLASQLAKKYEVLAIEKFDLREQAKRATLASPEGTDAEPVMRRNRTLAAVAELRLCLVMAFGGKGSGRVIEVDQNAHPTTKTCHACGAIETWDQAAKVEHTCSACGATWDQDDNAARNLVAIACEQLGEMKKAAPARGDGTSNEPAPMTESRWVRAKRMRAEKDVRKGGAREAVGEPAE